MSSGASIVTASGLTAFTVTDAFAISAAIIALLLTCVGLLLGMIFKRIMADLKTLAHNDEDLRNAVSALPREYVTRREFQMHEAHVTDALKNVQRTIESGFQRVYDKLDDKADRTESRN